jgi:hypothetical protein
VQPRDPLTRRNTRSLAQNKRLASTADIETKNAGWMASKFEYGLAPA